MQSRARNLLPPALILAVSLAVYANSLLNGFVLDDSSLVVSNYIIKDPARLLDAFTGNFWGFKSVASNYYRPLFHVILALEYWVFGLKPAGYHLVNVLFNAGCCLLAYFILQRLFVHKADERKNPFLSAPFLAALLFATHPVHAEAVAWVSGLTDLSCSFFYLLAFLLYMRSRNLTSAAVFFLGALSKEPALTLPVLLVCYDQAYGRRMSLKRLTPFIVAAGVYLLLRINALGGMAPSAVSGGITPLVYALNLPVLLAQYLKWLLLPLNLNVWHVFRPETAFSPIVAISALVVATLAVLATLASRKDRTALVGTMFLILPLLPALYITALTAGQESVTAERYLYLPVLGFSILAASAVSWAKDRLGEKKGTALLMALPVAVSLAFSAGTVARNTVWRDDYTLFMDTVRKSPDSAFPHKNLGRVLLNMDGRTDEAIVQLQLALKYEPDFAGTHNNLALAYYKKGRKDMALQEFATSLRLNPYTAETHANLGLIYLNDRDYDKAIGEFTTALRLRPYFEEAFRSLGMAYAELGEKDKAVYYLKMALTQNPNDQEARSLLSRLEGG